VEHIAVTRGIGPGELLAGAQARAGVGNRVIGIQSPRLQVQQMNGPGVAIAVVFGRQQITVGGGRIDAGENRLRT
jgi:hypothetical protein